MTKNNYLFTSESVSEGHPDKIADQISDAVLDAILEQDPKARVACETYVKTGMVMVGGEVTTSAWVDIEEITRETVREIGYVHSDMGFDADSCAVLNAIGKQSPDINQGVERKNPEDQGAGIQHRPQLRSHAHPRQDRGVRSWSCRCSPSWPRSSAPSRGRRP